MKKYISSFLITILCLATSCQKDGIEPKINYNDISSHIRKLIQQDSIFIVYFYNQPANSNVPYIVKASNTDIVVENTLISIKNTSYKFQFHSYQGMTVHYKAAINRKPETIDTIDIYFLK